MKDIAPASRLSSLPNTVPAEAPGLSSQVNQAHVKDAF
jgi:hypothetical protein